MTIGEKIKLKRLELAEDQTTFGKRFGVSHASISDMERGKSEYFHKDVLNFVFGLEDNNQSDIDNIYERLEKIEGFLDSFYENKELLK